MPILQSTEVDVSVEFYEQRLGFSCFGKWADDDGETHFSIVRLGDITVGLQRSNAVTPSPAWAAYLYVDDIAAYRDQIVANGASLNRDLEAKYYGCRDLDLCDPDGNTLCFGQDMSTGGNGPGL